MDPSPELRDHAGPWTRSRRPLSSLGIKPVTLPFRELPTDVWAQLLAATTGEHPGLLRAISSIQRFLPLDGHVAFLLSFLHSDGLTDDSWTTSSLATIYSTS